MALKAFRANNNKVVKGSSGRVDETVIDSSKSKNKKSKKLMCIPNIRAIKKPNFLTLDAKKAFNHLKLAFIKALIFRNFDLKSHILIKTNASGYTIGGVLSQLNFDSDASSNNLILVSGIR